MAECGGGCVCMIISIICTIVFLICGVYYLDYGENEYIDTKQDIERIEKEMIEYPEDVTTEQLEQTDVEIVYKGMLQNPPERPMVDSVFTMISTDAVQIRRNVNMWGVKERKDCTTEYINIPCYKSSSSSSSNSGSSTTWSDKRMKNYIVCTYSYSIGWTSTPKTCENINYWTQAHVDYSGNQYSRNSRCSSLTDNPRKYYQVQAGQETYSQKCSQWTSFNVFKSPCVGQSCTETQLIPKYEVGLFTATDPYIVEKYISHESPIQNALTFNASTSAESWKTCSHECNGLNCQTMYSANQNMQDICSRDQTSTFELGDQKVEWTVWPAKEDIYVCTKQEYSNGQWTMVQASIEGEGDTIQNIMDVDFDIVRTSKLTKDKCIEIYKEENVENLWEMRYLCAFLLIFSCVCAFTCCASIFDTFTDMLTYIPELIGEAIFCGPNLLSGFIDGVESCLDCAVYSLCGCIGLGVGVVFFFFVFAVIYVKARAGNEAMFAACGVILILVIVILFRFCRGVKKKQEELDGNGTNEPILLDNDAAEYQPQQNIGMLHQPPPPAYNAQPSLAPSRIYQPYPGPQDNNQYAPPTYPPQPQAYPYNQPPQMGYAQPASNPYGPTVGPNPYPPSQTNPYGAPQNQPHGMGYPPPTQTPYNQPYAPPPNQSYVPPHQPYAPPPATNPNYDPNSNHLGFA